jgi:hypothetical protein
LCAVEFQELHMGRLKSAAWVKIAAAPTAGFWR